MNRLSYTKILVVTLILSLFTFSCSSFSAKRASRRVEKQMAGPSRSAGKVKVREPRKVRSAKKVQEKKEARRKRDYQKHVSRSRKRTYDIQSPDVKARMKQNEAGISAREKAKDKKTRSDSKNRARKFR